MGECEKCGFLECRCPDHVAQNYVPKYQLRKLADELRSEKQHHSGFTYKTMKECWEDAHRRCAAKIDALIGGE